MNQSLFRHEVLQAREARWLGQISLAQPVPAVLLAIVPAALAVFVVAFVLFGGYTQRTRVVGQLVPTLGISHVTSRSSGTISEIRVVEGQQVARGDVLAVVNSSQETLEDGDTLAAMDRNVEARRDSVRDSYRSRRNQLESQREVARSRLAAGREELALVTQALATTEEKVLVAQEMLGRYEQLVQTRYVSELQLQQQKSVYLQSVSERQAMERQLAGIRRSNRELEQTLLDHPARVAELVAAEQQELSTLEQEALGYAAQGQQVLKAAVAGEVGAILGLPGQAVRAGETVMSLVPVGSSLEAHLMVPSRAIGFVEPGDQVLLRYQAYPYQKYGQRRGTVQRLSRGAIASGENGAEPHYRVIVMLEQQAIDVLGQPRRLRPGMALEADILGDRRRLWEWLMEPLFTLKNASSA